MTVAAGTRSSTAGDGSTVEFTATFRANSAAEIGVYVINDTTNVPTLQVLNTDYTVELDANGIPTITFDAGSIPASGETVLIYPNPTVKQVDSFTPGGSLYGISVENAIDKLAAQLQGIEDQLGQCLRVPQGDTALAELPSADGRASKTLTFDADGVPTLVAT